MVVQLEPIQVDFVGQGQLVKVQGHGRKMFLFRLKVKE